MIGREDVVKAAALARVRLTQDEVERLTTDLARVVGWIEELKAVDTEGVAPLMQPYLEARATRDDVAQPVLGPDALRGSAGFEDRLVRVPKVVE